MIDLDSEVLFSVQEYVIKPFVEKILAGVISPGPALALRMPTRSRYGTGPTPI